MYHIVYRTVNTTNSKFYIGVHSTYDLNDGYLGSGYNIARALKRYGRNCFEREILFIFDNKEDAYKKEAEIVTYEIIKNPLCYNIALGGSGCRATNTSEPFDKEFEYTFRIDEVGFKEWIECTEKAISVSNNPDFVEVQTILLPSTRNVWVALLNNLTHWYNSRSKHRIAEKWLDRIAKKNLLDCLYLEQRPRTRNSEETAYA